MTKKFSRRDFLKRAIAFWGIIAAWVSARIDKEVETKITTPYSVADYAKALDIHSAQDNLDAFVKLITRSNHNLMYDVWPYNDSSADPTWSFRFAASKRKRRTP